MAVTLNGKLIFPKLKHIKINNASKSIEKTENKLIELLYTLSYSSEFEETTIEFSDTQDDFSGTIDVQASYKTYIQYLIEKFYPNLSINYQNGYILFEDSNVEEIIVNDYLGRWYASEGYDGVIENMVMNQSGNENQRGFRQIFKDNKNISDFDELPQLTYGTHLASDEFRGTYNFKSIDLSRVEYIGTNAFRSSALEWFNGKKNTKGVLNLPKLGVTGLGGGAFQTIVDNSVYRGPKIIKIESLGECQVIKSNTFERNQTLQEIEDYVLQQLTEINYNAFYLCPNLTIEDLKLPNCTTIGNGAFQGTKVKKISELKSSVTIGEGAFYQCQSLRSINEWSNLDYDGDPNNPEDYPGDPNKTVALQNIKSIGQNAFYECTNLIIENLQLPLLISIGKNAFYKTGVKRVSNLGTITRIQGFSNCTNLTYVKFPDSVTEIGDDAFNNCNSLILPDITKYAYIGTGSFANITILPSILYLPKVINFIGYKAFENTNVSSLYLPNAKNTGGPENTSRPTPLTNQHRGGGWIFKLSANPMIVYFKNIEEIQQGIFGGNCASNIMSINTNIISMKNYSCMDGYYTTVNNSLIQKFLNDEIKVPINSSASMGEAQVNFSDYAYANIKYVVINNPIPQHSYWAYNRYGNSLFGCYGLWGNNDNGSKQSFKYLVVPSAAIETYKTWAALKPNVNESCLSTAEKTYIHTHCDFNINNIKPLEKMHHVKTKADWDALDIEEHPRKNEYLIEEYMGVAEGEIQWQESEWWDT